MKKEYIGINKLNFEGSRFEMGYGTSNFVNVKINNKKLVPLLSGISNTFGVSHEDRVKEKIYCGVKETKDCLLFFANAENINAPRWICGAPTIRIGESIWGPKNGFDLGQIKQYDKIKLSTKWDFKVKKGFADFSYDIWLTKKKDQKDNTDKQDLEIMVWLDYNFEVPWEKIGETKDFIIKYENKNKNELAKDKGHTIAFIRKQKKVEYNFEIIELVNYCSKYLKINFNSYYLRSIDLINEFTKDTQVKTSLYKMDLDLKKI